MADLDRVTLARAVDRLSDFVAVTDTAGVLAYLNPYGQELLDRPLDDVVGMSIIDLLHPDDVGRAAVAVGRTLDRTRKIPITPAFYRLRRADGRYVRLEVNGVAFEDDEGNHLGLVFTCRRTTDADLHDDLMDLLIADAPSEKAFELIPEFGRWRQPDLLHAVFHLDDGGQPRAAGHPALVSLGGEAHDWSPLAAAAEHGEPVIVAVDELGAEIEARAAAGGVTHLRIHPVWDPLHRRWVLAVLGLDLTHPNARDPHVLEVTRAVLDNEVRVLELVVAWRRQVLDLRRAAATDPLTGLANRTGFWNGLQGERDRGDVSPGPIAVLILDLDHFKEVNDTHGHTVGDALLLAVAERLRRDVRPGDVVARLGGDEFAVLLTDLAGGAADAAAIATRLVSAFAETFLVAGRATAVGASIGLATADRARFDPDALVDAADQALYRAKATGRGRWCVADGLATAASRW